MWCVCVLPQAVRSLLALTRVQTAAASHPERTVQDPVGTEIMSPQSRQLVLYRCCWFVRAFTLGVQVSSRFSARLNACSALWLRRSARAVWASCTRQLSRLHKSSLLLVSTFFFWAGNKHHTMSATFKDHQFFLHRFPKQNNTNFCLVFNILTFVFNSLRVLLHSLRVLLHFFRTVFNLLMILFNFLMVLNFLRVVFNFLLVDFILAAGNQSLFLYFISRNLTGDKCFQLQKQCFNESHLIYAESCSQLTFLMHWYLWCCPLLVSSCQLHLRRRVSLSGRFEC